MKKFNFKKVGIVIKNNYIINRSLPIILFIVSLIIGSLIGAMPISDIETRYAWRINVDIEAYENYRYQMENTYDILTKFDGVFSLVSVVAAMIIPILACLSINQYMRDKSGNDFYHSLCVNRRELYAANFITVFVNTSITVILSNLAGLFFMNLMANYKPMTFWGLVSEQIPVMVSVVLFAAVFTALAMISCTAGGTAFSSIINYIALNFAIPGTILCVSVAGYSIFRSTLMDWLAHFPSAYVFTSPLLRYIYAAGGVYEFTALTYVALAVITALLIFAGMFIYGKKKNENGSKPLVFKCTVRPLQYLVTFNVMLLAGTLFYAITDSVTWCVIGVLISLFLSFIAYNAFINKSFNGVFKGASHMLYMLLALILLGAVFVADVFGIYKEPTPDTENITNGYFHVTYRYPDREEWYSYNFEEEANNLNIQLTDEIEDELAELYSLLAKFKNEYINNSSYVVYDDKNKEMYISISLGIKCKNDLETYNIYCTLNPDTPEYERINEILTGFIEKYPTDDENVYYFEETMEVTAPEEEIKEVHVSEEEIKELPDFLPEDEDALTAVTY